ncbi:polysaccharide deacetylase family protein [Coraliomargarita sp. SDUM461003]|uniref:Polysaccharide deacetylase family protein n=1 Tax=Thalassobacterium maritimum TaxID=3041265 RepID=A0ABU1AWZ4_9BACT|nr:polysaccharide deacetylase family protein [Coraliomargarita sp. SDUM461003]MDQ8208679.1 polysaccharide deacetylase family protein [Coraliomargarita sp. SDUM461003]
MLTSATRVLKQFCRLLALCTLSLATTSQANESIGHTQVATWKDNRTAAFMLMFDDGWPGQLQVGVPALQERQLTATFYMVPDKGEYKQIAAKWAEAIQGGYIIYGNHTMTHGGVRDYQHAQTEIKECTRIIREELQPIPGKPKRLISFAQPGVKKGKWTLPKEDLIRVLEEDNMIRRPTFRDHGAVYHLQELEEMTALAEKAIATQGTEYLILHGVERIGAKWQDFWALKQDIFFPLLDDLAEKQAANELWVTDHISWHQYKTEREAATVEVLNANESKIELKLSADVDPELYDLPLTLITKVPSSWKQCHITQGESKWLASAEDGELTFDALPNGPQIQITPVKL